MSRIYWNEGWQFAEQYREEMQAKNYGEGQMQPVRLPHTCKELPFHYFDEQEYQMVCGYRRVFQGEETWKGKRLFLTFEGVAHTAEVYLNGTSLAAHHCGYTAFTVELTGHVDWDSENVLVVKVDTREQQNIPPFGYVVDYMTFGGIYRDVYLEIKEQEFVQDVFVKTSFPEGTLDGDVQRPQKAQITSVVTVEEGQAGNAATGLLYLKQYLVSGSDRILLGETQVGDCKVELVYPVENILLWDITAPNLYELETELIFQGKEVDVHRVRFGFRRIEFRASGFYLNGRKVKLRGLNRHQSYPYVGYAMPESMQKLDADIVKKELGCNAVRTSHYPQSHYFMDRCDGLGLLVFTEFPGWQHIGDEAWKEQALVNLKEMILQYRNHPSIILWGVRINESVDDDAFYQRTNALARELDESRPTGGVRAHKKSHLFEDVYTYNDFSHDGTTPGCEPKEKVTSDMGKAYLVSEYNGHMYPTKPFDWEEHRMRHALRHATVLDAVAGQEDIAGCFGWCMFDYNTHKDFGSGDRICYHGVMDMFRNPKLAALVYACEQEEETVLELSSSMDIGEHPGCNRGYTYIFSNADSVRMYKNDRFIKEYTRKDSPYKNLRHGPMIIDDFIGEEIVKNESFTKKQAALIKEALNYVALHGYHFPPHIIGIALRCMVCYHMKPTEAVALYNKYVGDWGGTSTVYRFEAVREGQVVKTITKKPMKKMHMELTVSSNSLQEKNSYDVAEIRIQAQDESGNQLYFYNDPLVLTTRGPIEIIGPKVTALRGGMTGVYVKSTGICGEAELIIENPQLGRKEVKFTINKY